MPLATGPNWLTLLGLVYLVYALGFLTASAFADGGLQGAGDGTGGGTGRRVMTAFAGGVGIVGLLLQMLGQVATLEAGGWAVLGLLSLIVLLLGYVVASGRVADAVRDAAMPLARSTPTSTTTPEILGWRTAAE